MAEKSPIEWLRGLDGSVGSSWNPIKGREPGTGKTKGWACVKVSPACAHCYAESLNLYLGNKAPYLPGKHAEPVLSPKALHEPMTWIRGRRVFVCSMTDLFWEAIPSEWLDRIFDVMLLCRQHNFLLLTKRAERMADWINGWLDFNDLDELPPNIWCGVTAENQTMVNQRVPALLRIPATRYLSVEPLLGPIDLGGEAWRLHWLITGGESGPKHRRFDPAWAASLRDQALAAGIAYLHKQNGGRTPKAGGRLLEGREWNQWPALWPDGQPGIFDAGPGGQS